MYFYHNNNVAWIKIPKNACSSWEHVFTELQWQKDDLLNPTVDISKLKFFGYLQDPYVRHTKGIVEYVIASDLEDLVSNYQFNKILVSAVFDEHTLSVSHMIPESITNRTTFFVLDHNYFNYEVLVRNFLNSYNVTLPNLIPRLNTSSVKKKELFNLIAELKIKYSSEFDKMAKNFFERDVILYAQHLSLQHHWDRPGDIHIKI